MTKKISKLLFVLAVILFAWGSIIAWLLDAWVGMFFILCAIFCFFIRKWKGFE
jgi:hypothetical protein